MPDLSSASDAHGPWLDRDADLGGHHDLRPGGNRREKTGAVDPALHFFADFERHRVRENNAESTGYRFSGST